jgi:formate/nitrite transporter FocA (FNT family)
MAADSRPRRIEELVVELADQCAEKYAILRQRPWAFCLLSLTGGAMVGFGAILALAVSAGIPWPGIANLLMGVVFGFSLLLILVSGASLVTADMVLGVLGVFHRRISWGQFALLLLASYLGNAAGSLLVSLLVFFGGGGYDLAPWLLRAHQIAALKTGLSDVQAFAMGCLCTWILQTAVVLFFKMRTEPGRMLVAYYGPLAFVAGMTEHCIANIGFIVLPILQQPLLTRVAHVALKASGPLARLSWGFGPYGWAHNQVFTLMGNFVGGAVLVGVVLHLASDPQRVVDVYRARAAQVRQLHVG